MKVFPALGVSGNQSHALNLNTLVSAAKNMGAAATEVAEALQKLSKAFGVPAALLHDAALQARRLEEEKKARESALMHGPFTVVVNGVDLSNHVTGEPGITITEDEWGRVIWSGKTGEEKQHG